ncbi:hypothetical protein [Massilibacteroides sp.]|uniref:hypothetical protein n=1 Tax=Massilibacteroides sp. TaxID=2034766 RepID=UPI00261DB600|nr:hypothetical protein [Massilibacteroides sp.]MDD4513960.1 hypothetical protein [Massilibacteroides sp.]
MKTILSLVLVLLSLFSCSSLSVMYMTSGKMEKLELGMSKKEVTHILGNAYTIAEKRIEEGRQVEVLSYRDIKGDEFYMFVLVNNKLEEWYREIIPLPSTGKE